MFYLNFGIPPVLVFQLEVYYKVDRLLNGLTAQGKGTTARWYSNKTSLNIIRLNFHFPINLTKTPPTKLQIVQDSTILSRIDCPLPLLSSNRLRTILKNNGNLFFLYLPTTQEMYHVSFRHKTFFS